MIVADASAIVELVLETVAGTAVGDRLLLPGETIHVPHFLDVEVAHALRRYALLGAIEAEEGEEALADLIALPLQRHEHAPLLQRAWELRRTISVYDAMYIALAELLSAPLVTRDRRLASARGHDARIELF